MTGRKKKSDDRPSCGAVCTECHRGCCTLYVGHTIQHFSYTGMGGCGHTWK